MRWKLVVIVGIQAILVIGLGIGVASGLFPLGIRNEWEWLRVAAKVPRPWAWFALAVCVMAAYAVVVALGLRRLRAASSTRSEWSWLAVLLVSAIIVQVGIPVGAPDEHDLTKWAYVNYLSGSTGYFKIARDQAARHPWQFLREYPDWIVKQDSLHIGTHPPGLIVAQCILIRSMEDSPGLARFLDGHMPPSVAAGFRQIEGMDRRPIRLAERAALYATALLTLFACAGTVVPLYWLARSALPPSIAWAAASLWPVMPAANLFQPVADTTYPLLATMAWAMAAWAQRWRGEADGRRAATAYLLAAGSGFVMGFGMVFTLAFLPVGLVVALFVASNRSLRWSSRIGLIVATGAGFLAFLIAAWLISWANPFVVWSWNLHHHARFYDEYPRTYQLWLWVNFVEMAVAIGLPTTVWLVLGLLGVRGVPRVVWAMLFVVVLVDLTGRNMGEVARLWMLYTPPFLIAAARGMERLGGGPVTLAGTTALIGLQTLTLQTMIQTVYPVD